MKSSLVMFAGAIALGFSLTGGVHPIEIGTLNQIRVPQKYSMPVAAEPLIFAGQGCCSWHGGECGCQDGRDVCCDGTFSPSCTCHNEVPPHRRHARFQGDLIVPVPTGLVARSGVNGIFQARARSSTPSYMSVPSSVFASVMKRLTFASFSAVARSASNAS
jgi:hypothetical protein